ncbi:hypothetical protein H8959_011840, partial [Pygathrix nigripes]
MAYYESGYNTTAQRVLDDGSIDYGIFQINSVTWCRHGKLQENNHCHVACSGKAGRNTVRGETCPTGKKA